MYLFLLGLILSTLDFYLTFAPLLWGDFYFLYYFFKDFGDFGELGDFAPDRAFEF